MPFEPSYKNGLSCRQAICGRLADSIDHVVDRSAGHLEFSEQAGLRLTRSLRETPPKAPFLYARFFTLVDAIKRDDLEAAQVHITKLLGMDVTNHSATTVTRYSQACYNDEQLEQIDARFLNKSGEPIIKPSELGPDASDQVSRALNMLREGAPETAAEIDEIVTSFLVAAGNTSKRGTTFDGVSNLEMWGLVAINEAVKKSDLEMAETLAHEAAHCTLFGLSPVDFFVTNPDIERYSSPLRADPRPMDGIYHATFVSARMHFAVRELAASGTLTSEQQAEAQKLLTRSASNFRDGYKILEGDAHYTDRGAGIMASVVDYMSDKAIAA